MKGLLVADIDDTLVKTNTSIIKRAKDGTEQRLTSEEFAHDTDKHSDKFEYDFREFDDANKIRDGILTGKPLIKNLKVLDHYANKGYEIAFLTARSNEDLIYKTLLKFLKVRNKEGQLEPILMKLSRELSVAIEDKKYEGIFHTTSHPNRKAEVLNDYCELFDEVVYIDDDLNNIAAAEKLHKPNLKIIKALKEQLIY
jgi:phosphoglycolate phosphatase-like HAD superfamily hydrolase